MVVETKKRGRPKKRDVVSKLPGNRGQVGRPKGDTAIMNEYKARLLASPNSEKVIQTIFSVALDPEHKHWPAAMRFIGDRAIPMHLFDEKERGSKPIVQINLQGFSTTPTVEEVTDIEPKDY